MKDLEGNKIVAAILVAGLIALITGKIANGLYHPVENPEKRGYKVEVASNDSSLESAAKTEEILDIPALLAAANIENGRANFKKCASCHTNEPGGAHRVGPNLAAVVNSKIASKNGYGYSSALSAKGDSWTYENLFAFLKKPQAFAPGTKMSFAGFKDAKDIADMVKFLESN
jgi:cytochrome c